MKILDSVLFGKGATTNIVGVQYVKRARDSEAEGPEVVKIYRRDKDGVHVEDRPFHPFIHLSDIDLLAGARRASFKVRRLEGDNYYKYIVVFESWNSMWNGLRAIKDNLRTKEKKVKEVYAIFNPEQQYLMQSGETMFKGMQFNDVSRLNLDIEAYASKKTESGASFPQASRKKDVIFIISLSDNNGWGRKLYLADGKAAQISPSENEIAYETEAELLAGMVDIIQTRDPDVIVGHNLFGFDLPYIETRCKLHNVEFAIGRDGSVPETWESGKKFAERQVTFQQFRIAGRAIIDTYFEALSFDIFKRDLPGYGLKEVAKYFDFAAEDREYIPGDQIATTWDDDPERVLKYAMDDVLETGLIAEHLGASTFYLTQMVPMDYQKVALSGTASKIEALLTREYIKRLHSLPAAENGRQEVGGYTDIFHTGRIEKVIYADVESLYPSIMLAYDIKPDGDALDVFQYILRLLKDLRFEAKDAMNRCEKGSQEYNALDAKQSAYKAVINSFFGILGFLHSIWNDFSEADRVTTTGQGLLKMMIDIMIGDGGDVTESDTDGILGPPPPFAVYGGPSVLESIRKDAPKFTFSDENAAKILSGEKRTTLRTRKASTGFYLLGDTDQLIHCEYLGNLDVNQADAIVGNVIETEAFGPDGPLYSHTREFLAGIRKLHLHRIQIAIDDEQYVNSMTDRMPEGITVGFDGRADVLLSYKKKNYALLEPGKAKAKIKGGSLISRMYEPFGKVFVGDVIRGLLNNDVLSIHRAYRDIHQKVITSNWTPEEFSKTATIKDSMKVYTDKINAGVGNGGRNRSAIYELAIKRETETGQKAEPGDRITCYVAGDEKAYKVRAFEASKLSSDWTQGDENTNHYLARLKTFAKKFEVFFNAEDFKKVFSEVYDADYPYDKIRITTKRIERIPIPIIVAGSRTITDPFWMERAFAGAAFLKKISDKGVGYTPGVIISGGAKGADHLGEEWAKRNGVEVVRMPADWDQYGKSAGPIRNAEMLKYAQEWSLRNNGGPPGCIVVWDGESRGSAHMASIAKKANFQVHVSHLV